MRFTLAKPHWQRQNAWNSTTFGFLKKKQKWILITLWEPFRITIFSGLGCFTQIIFMQNDMRFKKNIIFLMLFEFMARDFDESTN